MSSKNIIIITFALVKRAICWYIFRDIRLMCIIINRKWLQTKVGNLFTDLHTPATLCFSCLIVRDKRTHTNHSFCYQLSRETPIIYDADVLSVSQGRGWAFWLNQLACLLLRSFGSHPPSKPRRPYTTISINHHTTTATPTFLAFSSKQLEYLDYVACIRCRHRFPTSTGKASDTRAFLLLPPLLRLRQFLLVVNPYCGNILSLRWIAMAREDNVMKKK